jgi:NitT/TauT family transport system ATP-binding protein
MQPDLILMDEPFASLDAPTRETLQNLTLDLQAEQHLTLVIVTHSIEEAAVLGKKILILTHPPNSHPTIIPNPYSNQADYRQSPTFREVVQLLRTTLESSSGTGSILPTNPAHEKT